MLVKIQEGEDQKCRMGTELVVKICKSDFNKMREFRKIPNRKNIWENEGKSKTRSNGTKLISCRSCQSNMVFCDKQFLDGKAVADFIYCYIGNC